MTDLTKPFFGNPRETAKADKARAKRAVPYETTWLDEVLRGMFGETDPAGSLAESGALDADPIRAAAGEQKFAKKRTANSLGQAAGVAWDLSDMVNPVTLAAGGLASVMSMSNLPKGLSKTKKGRQAGAIRVGGADDLYASHAFNPYRANDIARDGYLRPPSIAVSGPEPNAFRPESPQFIFRAGAVDPAKNVGTMVNRDGYFANPTGIDYSTGKFDPASLANEINYYLNKARNEYGLNDLRLTEVDPLASQALAIGTSPAFKSFEEFEKLPEGRQALRGSHPDRQAYWRETEDQMYRLLTDKYGGPSMKDSNDYVKEIVKKYYRDPSILFPEELALLERARRSPSSMAEFKIYDKLDLGPNDAYVYLPKLGGSERSYEDLYGGLRDKGFQFVTPRELTGGQASDLGQAALHLPGTVPPSGEFQLPLRLDPSRETADYEQFLNFTQGKAGGGTPPLSITQPSIIPPKLDPETIPGLKPDVVDFLKVHDTPSEAKGTIDDLVSEGLLGPVDADDFYSAINKAWPKEPLPSMPDFPLAKAKTPVEIGTLSTHSVFESSIPASKKAQWEQILDNNEDYGLVAENAFKKYDIDPAFVPAIIDHLKHQQLMELHKDPNWQTILDKIIGATWGGMKPSK